MARHCIFYSSFHSLDFFIWNFDVSTALQQPFSMMIQNEKYNRLYTHQRGGGKFRDKGGRSQRKRQRKHQRGGEHMYDLLCLPSFIVSSFILLFIASSFISLAFAHCFFFFHPSRSAEHYRWDSIVQHPYSCQCFLLHIRKLRCVGCLGDYFKV